VFEHWNFIVVELVSGVSKIITIQRNLYLQTFLDVVLLWRKADNSS
jgi:hypothetical protein